MTTKIAPELLDASTLAVIRNANPIINGDMRIDQRNGGASITVPSGSAFVVDRWRSGMSGANGTGQRVACSLTGFPSMVRLTGTSSTTACWHGQYIESVNVVPHIGKRVTVQVRMASSTVTAMSAVLKAPTVADNFTSTTTLETKNFTISSTLTYYEITFDNVLPASAANGLYLEFVTTTNLGTGTLDITGVQIDFDNMATPFQVRSYGHELALCQRYFYKANASPLGVTLNVSDGYSALVNFPVQMRINPTLESGATYTVGSGSAGTVAISATNGEVARLNNSGANWTANVTVSVTAGFTAEIS